MTCRHAALIMLCMLRQASKVMIAVRREFACEVLTAQLFKTSTIAGLAAALQHASTAAEEEASIVPRASFSAQERAAGVPCSANQEQMLVLHAVQPDSSGYNMAEVIRLRAPVDIDALQARICPIYTCVHTGSHLRHWTALSRRFAFPVYSSRVSAC